MNQEVKQEWLTALRSGRYKKGKNYLHSNDCFCALGVLCDLYLQDIKKNWSKTSLFKIYECAGETQELPRAVAEWAELEDVPYFDINVTPAIKKLTSISELNDKWTGNNFDRIADLIEENL